MLLIGTQTATEAAIRIDLDSLLHHTLVVGQSGSGKSFFVARLLEEILLRTRARMLIVDPNGDFRRLGLSSDSVWDVHSARFNVLHGLNQVDASDFDTPSGFQIGWQKRRFTYLNPARSPRGTVSEEDNVHKLIIHWDSLEPDLQRFLLKTDPSREPKAGLGIDTIVKTAEWLRASRSEPYEVDLRSLADLAEDFALRNRSLQNYEAAKTLTIDDWYAVHAKVSDVLSNYALWWSRRPDRKTLPGSRPLGLADFIDATLIEQNRSATTYWDALVLSLDSASQADALLSVEVSLSRLWQRAKDAWRLKVDQGTKVDYPDKRVPTFIVIDEAHNFSTEHSSNDLQKRVTARLMQIASEGRKYGLYLILATQRPTKLHKELVAECENSCLLRVQSDIELKYACIL